MPIYRLWRVSDNETFEEDARDEHHALVVFGELLGVKLTLEEGPPAPEYMLDPVETELHWNTPLTTPVWEVGERP